MAQPLIAVGDIIQTQILGEVNDTSMMTVLTWKVDAYTGALPCNLALAALGLNLSTSALMTDYQALLPTAYTINSIRTQRVSPTRSAAAFTTLSLAGTWSGGVNNQPGTASTFWRYTDTSGRSQRSVTHVPALPQNAVLANALTSGYIAALNVFAIDCLANYNTSLSLAGSFDVTPIVPHRKKPLPWTGDVLVSHGVNTTPRTERRRVSGYGQ